MAKKKRNKPKKKTVVKRSRYIEALYEEMRNGSVDATRELGRSYIKGEDVERNYGRAFTLLQSAYEQSDPYAPALLASLYYKGKGIERDAEQAMALLEEGIRRGDRLAADMKQVIKDAQDDPYILHTNEELELDGMAGDDNAYEALGDRYLAGEDTRQSDDIAYRYYVKAYHDEGEAACQVGIAYANPDDETYMMSRAKKWLEKAVASGSTHALYALGELYVYDAQLSSEEGIAFLKQAAERNHTEALGMLGTIYQEGKLVPMDVRQSIHYYERAIALGETRMQPYLGLDYLTLADEESVAHGLQLLEDGISQGMDMAYFCLAYAYATGTGVPFDKEKAFAWVQNARAHHVPNVNQFYETIGAIIHHDPDNLMLKFYQTYDQEQYEDAESYAKELLDCGDGNAAVMMAEYCKKAGLDEQMLNWLYDAAAVGTPKAYGILGDLYMAGDAVPRDEQQAFKLYQEGAQRDDAHCLLKLSKAYQTGQGVARDLEKADAFQKKAYDLTFHRED